MICISPGGAVLKQHFVHYITHAAHVAVHQVPIHIQRSGYITVSQPCLYILNVTAALAQSVHRTVPQIMETASQTMGLDHSPEVVGHKIRINGCAVRLRTDTTGIDVRPSKKPLVLILLRFQLQQIVI